MTHPALQTRFTQRFQLTTPIALAPMALATGGALAAACAQAGALALVGGGYGDLAWTQREYALATDLLKHDAASHARLGCGFITWKLDENAAALDWVLSQKPCAIMLSFGDPRPYATRIAEAGAQLICQVQRLDQVPQAIEAGASIIVAQGGEAGGHGANALEGRSTFTLVPEIADHLAAHAPNTLLLCNRLHQASNSARQVRQQAVPKGDSSQIAYLVIYSRTPQKSKTHSLSSSPAPAK